MSSLSMFAHLYSWMFTYFILFAFQYQENDIVSVLLFHIDEWLKKFHFIVDLFSCFTVAKHSNVPEWRTQKGGVQPGE